MCPPRRRTWQPALSAPARRLSEPAKTCSDQQRRPKKRLRETRQQSSKETLLGTLRRWLLFLLRSVRWRVKKTVMRCWRSFRRYEESQAGGEYDSTFDAG